MYGDNRAEKADTLTATAKNIAQAAAFFLLLLLLFCQTTGHIADRMFWTDEVTTFKVTLLPFFEIPYAAAVTSSHMQPPLYYFAGKFASYLATDVVTLRAVSVSFYILTIFYIVFFFQEIRFSSRIIFSITLIVAPFAEYAATNFRPYSFAVFAIVLSSVYLYRALSKPACWPQVIKYYCAASLLQYTLTLNCFVFAVQILAVVIFIIINARNNGFHEALSNCLPIITISLILCIQYIPFLYVVSLHSGRHVHGGLISYFNHLVNNFGVLDLGTLRIESLMRYPVALFFMIGCLIGLWKHSWIILYLLSVFIGQYLFSTYMTYESIPWFVERYLVASYVAFCFICAIGAELLFRRCTTSFVAVITSFLLIYAIRGGVGTYIEDRKNPHENYAKIAVEKLRCAVNKTIIIGDPQIITNAHWYLYRSDPSIYVADPSIYVGENNKDVMDVISSEISQNNCIILQEFQDNPGYSGEIFSYLSTLSDYDGKKYDLTKGGWHVPGSAWLFKPD